MKVVLTYSLGRLVGLAEALYDEGFDVEHTPLIETVSLQDEETKRQAKALLDCPWLLFTSQKAVETWHELNQDKMPKQNINTTPKHGAVGQQTAAALRQRGYKIDLVAQPQNAQGLINCFTSHPEACGPVGLAQGNLALDDLETGLERMGFETQTLTIYQTRTQEWQAKLANIIVVASPSALAAIPDEVAIKAQFISLGKTTQDAVTLKGWNGLKASEPTIDAVLDVLDQLVPA